jgi:hypothetical protein
MAASKPLLSKYSNDASECKAVSDAPKIGLKKEPAGRACDEVAALCDMRKGLGHLRYLAYEWKWEKEDDRNRALHHMTWANWSKCVAPLQGRKRSRPVAAETDERPKKWSVECDRATYIH